MAKKLHLVHVKSAVADKAPSASTLNYGEIAVNYNSETPALYIRDDEDNIVKFISEPYFTKIVGTGITENDGETITPLTEVIEQDEITISAALNDLNDRKADKEYVDGAISGVTADIDDLSDEVNNLSSSLTNNYYTKDEVDDAIEEAMSGVTIDVDDHLDSASTNPVENRAIYDVIVKNEKVVASALNNINDRKEDKENKVTELTSGSTDDQYPSAKAVYDALGSVEMPFEFGTGLNSAVLKGGNCIASGTSSVAEGARTIAGGDGSHAEGLSTIASGQFSHAEGSNTVAVGSYSHAEGSSTTAATFNSHAEGECTVAKNKAEHAEGRYNVSNSESDTFGSSGNTQHSFGIGTTNNDRKNAFEVMQNGDAYLYGVGNYDGTNATASTANTIQTSINNAGQIPIEITMPASGFLPNVMYNIGPVTANTTFLMQNPTNNTIVNHYYWTFDILQNVPTITWPAGITWVGGSEPTINASKHYEISVLNGIGVAMEV